MILARTHMASWDVGTAMPAQVMLRPLLNAQSSPLLASIDTQDEIVDALEYKVRVLNVGIVKTMPRFMLNTLPMRRRAKVTQTDHRPYGRVHIRPRSGLGWPKDVVDAYLALHASDPQFLPEFGPGAAVRGDLDDRPCTWATRSALPSTGLLKNPELYERVTAEADALWAEGDPGEDDFSRDRIDVTSRVLMETLRMSPIVAMSMRTVMNTCVVEGYELPVGTQLLIAQTATHYLEETFPDPWTFDIDRYASPAKRASGWRLRALRAGHALMSRPPLGLPPTWRSTC